MENESEQQISNDHIKHLVNRILELNPSIVEKHSLDTRQTCLLFLQNNISSCKSEYDKIIGQKSRKKIMAYFFDVVSKLPSWLERIFLQYFLNTKDNAFHILLHTHEGWHFSSKKTNTVEKIEKRIDLLPTEIPPVKVVMWALKALSGRRSILAGEKQNDPWIIGVDMKTRPYKYTKHQFWLTSEHERSKCLNLVYMKDTKITVFACPCDDLPDIKSDIGMVKHKCPPDTRYMLVVTKMDLYQPEYQQELNQIKQYCQQNGIKYLECSVETGVGLETFWETLLKLTPFDLKQEELSSTTPAPTF